MRRVRRCRRQRALDHLGHLLVLDASGPARPGLVQKAVEAVLGETSAPLAHGVLMHAEFGRDHLARQSLGATQDDLAPLRESPANPMTADLAFEVTPLLIAQNNRHHRTTTATRHHQNPP